MSPDGRTAVFSSRKKHGYREMGGATHLDRRPAYDDRLDPVLQRLVTLFTSEVLRQRLEAVFHGMNRDVYSKRPPSSSGTGTNERGGKKD